jgi:uncharacterized protein YcgI (DUF1989 family)
VVRLVEAGAANSDTATSKLPLVDFTKQMANTLFEEYGISRHDIILTPFTIKLDKLHASMHTTWRSFK